MPSLSNSCYCLIATIVMDASSPFTAQLPSQVSFIGQNALQIQQFTRELLIIIGGEIPVEEVAIICCTTSFVVACFLLEAFFVSFEGSRFLEPLLMITSLNQYSNCQRMNLDLKLSTKMESKHLQGLT